MRAAWVRLAVCVGAALLLPMTVRAQDARLRERLAPPVVERVGRLVDSARAVGLPTEPLIQKALEGASKGAPADRIVAAVVLLLDGLTAARRELGPDAEPTELQAGAIWLRSGGSTEELAKLRARAPGRSLAIPLVVSADLVARGLERSEALDGVRRLLDLGVSDGAFLALRNVVDQAVRRGVSVATAARNEVSRLESGGRSPL